MNLSDDLRTQALRHPALRLRSGMPGFGNLELRFSGLRSASGYVRVALFNLPKGFPQQQTEAFRVVSLAISADLRAACALRDLPYGRYALAFYHDENNNGRLDLNRIGQPTEDYGFSNGARGIFGPPKFSDAAFTLNATELALSFRLQRVRPFVR